MNMKKMLAATCLLVFTAVFCGVSLVMTGCEGGDTDTADMDEYFENNQYQSDDRPETTRNLSVNPSAAQVTYVGQQVVFEGVGGETPYSWSVADSSVGTVVVRGYSQGVYTALRVGNNQVTCVDQNGHSAVASVLPETTTLSISPSSYTVEMDSSSYGYASFYASGGSPPYTWTVASPGLGSISYSASSSENASYRVTQGAYGVNIITVKDSDGRTASATVTQTAPSDDE